MSGLILPKRFRQQPTGPIRLREDGIAQGVILAAPLRQPGEIITRRLGQIFPVETGVGRVVGPYGIAANFNGSVQINLGTAPILEAGKPFSFCLRIKATSASAYGAPLCLRYGTTGLLFIRGTATEYYAAIGPIQGGGSTPRNFNSAGPATVGADEFWVVTNASGPETASGYTAYLNGVGLTYVSSSFGSGTATTSYIGWDGFDTKWSGPIQDLVVWDRALSPDEAREISYNPWLIYETKPRPVYFSAAAGATAVTSDLADSYVIRAAVSQDFADSYAIRAAVATELADSYGVLSAVAANLADAYSINAAVNADLNDSYLLRVTVAQDLADSYSVRAAVASNLADSYDLANAGVVVSDLADAYLIRATIASDMTDSAAIRAAVMAEIENAYAIRVAASNDLVDGYTIINAVSTDLIDGHAIRAAVAADLLDAYSVFSGPGTGATVGEIVAAILAAAQATPLHVDVRAVKGQSIVGFGTEADPWGP